MALTLGELKELITFGQEIGLQQLTAEGVSVTYGQHVNRASYQEGASHDDDNATILAHYSALGREKLKGHSTR